MQKEKLVCEAALTQANHMGNLEAWQGTRPLCLHIYQSLDIGTLVRGYSMVEMTLYLK